MRMHKKLACFTTYVHVASEWRMQNSYYATVLNADLNSGSGLPFCHFSLSSSLPHENKYAHKKNFATVPGDCFDIWSWCALMQVENAAAKTHRVLLTMAVLPIGMKCLHKWSIGTRNLRASTVVPGRREMEYIMSLRKCFSSNTFSGRQYQRFKNCRYTFSLK